MTNYPDQIDNSISLPEVVDNLTPVKASVANNLRDAILAIEKELGTQPSSIYGTVKTRLDTIETNLNNLPIIQLAGDLGHSLSAPYVIGIWGRPISSVAPNLDDVLVWDGIAWSPSPTPSTSFGFAGGDLSGSYPNPNVAKIQGNPVFSQTLGSDQDGYVLTWINSNGEYQAKPAAIGFAASGDLSGTSTNQTVIGIQGNPIEAQILGASEDGYVLTWVNASSQWQAKHSISLSTLYFPLLSGVSSTNSSVFYVVVGAAEFDITKLPVGTYTIKFQILLETTGPLASAQLYNFSTASVVTGTALTTSSTSAVLLTTGDISSDLTNGSAIYQAQIEMASGGVSDQITCSMARLLIEYI